jgi:ketosteroid isomerase-like protein
MRTLMLAKLTLGSALLVAQASCKSTAREGDLGTADQVSDTAKEQASSARGGRDSAAVIQELLRLEEEWNAAFERHDPAALERIIADDYLAYGPDTLTKRQVVEEAKDTSVKIDDWSNDDMRVRVFGGSSDVAVVTGRNTQKGKSRTGKPFNTQVRFTEVWVNREGRWQCIAGHYTQIHPKRPA